MIQIEIRDAKIDEFAGEKNGRKYHIRKQRAWAHLPNEPYPTAISINVRDNDPPHQPGRYHLDAASLFVDKYGSLGIGRLVLKPVAATTATTSRVA